MTEYGVTPTGFRRKTAAEIKTDIDERMWSLISANLDLSETSDQGNINAIFADETGLVWEALEACYFAQDPDAAELDALAAISAITGVAPDAPEVGVVTATCTFTPGFTADAREMIAHVAGDPENRWVNQAAVPATSASEDIVFVSEVAGSSAIANAGTLTVRAVALSGWLSITNALDATPGDDGDTSEELRTKREDSLGIQGTSPLNALKADVQDVTGVISVAGIENVHDTYKYGIPPHQFRLVVWDGSPAAATNSDIATRIRESKAAGVGSFGSVSVAFTTDDGATEYESFDRATQLEVYVDVTVYAPEGVAESDVKTAIIAKHTQAFGQDVIRAKLSAGATLVNGVEDVTALTLGLSPSPTGTANIQVAWDEMGLLDSLRINVTVVT